METNSDQCLCHGLLDLCLSVHFVLGFHLVASYTGIAFLPAFHAGFGGALQTVQQLQWQGIIPDCHEVTFWALGMVSHVQVVDNHHVLQLIVLCQNLFRQRLAQLLLLKTGPAVLCHTHNFQHPGGWLSVLRPVSSINSIPNSVGLDAKISGY